MVKDCDLLDRQRLAMSYLSFISLSNLEIGHVMMQNVRNICSFGNTLNYIQWKNRECVHLRKFFE